MSDFEFELKQAFHAQEEPGDHGFTVAVSRRVAKREAGRSRVRFLALGGVLAGASAVATNLAARIFAAAPPLEQPVEAAQSTAVDWVETIGLGAMQSVGWLSAISPLAMVLAGITVAAFVYVAQPE